MHGLIHARRGATPKVFHGRSSRIYDLLSRRLLRPMYRRLAADLAQVAPDGAAVLDVGTGPGVLLVELTARRPDLRLTGVDLSPDMIAAATRNLEPFRERASARVADVTTLPFPDRSVRPDRLLAEPAPLGAPEAAVPELARILRPGGRVYIYDFPFAPFDKLTDSARTRSVLNGHPPEQTPIRTGIPFLRCVRYVMSP